MPKDEREFEAEAVAYFVTDRMNLDIVSVSYLAGYLDHEWLPNYSLDAVLKAVGKIEEMLAGRFRAKKPKKTAPATAPSATPRPRPALHQDLEAFIATLD